MEVSVHPVSSKRLSGLYRVLLKPLGASSNGELYCEDDELRFREKGLDLQDFAPSYIEVHQFTLQANNGSPLFEEQSKAPQLQVFIYSFSYLPDPTWLVNWENGENLSDWFDKETFQMKEKPKQLELEEGEYIHGALIELVDHQPEGVKGLRIVSFMTNNNRELTITKSPSPSNAKGYKLQLPDGYGIVGRNPSPLYSFGLYVSWMIPHTWSLSKSLWFPKLFRKRVQTLLLIFYRLGKELIHEEDYQESISPSFPFAALECIIHKMNELDHRKPAPSLEDPNCSLIEEY